MSEPVTDEAAIAAAQILLAYHEERARSAVLDIIGEYHLDFIERLRAEIVEIPERTAAKKRVAERYHDDG
jgi:hypothetical protein